MSLTDMLKEEENEIASLFVEDVSMGLRDLGRTAEFGITRVDGVKPARPIVCSLDGLGKNGRGTLLFGVKLGEYKGAWQRVDVKRGDKLSVRALIEDAFARTYPNGSSVEYDINDREWARAEAIRTLGGPDAVTESDGREEGTRMDTEDGRARVEYVVLYDDFTLHDVDGSQRDENGNR